ncbi:MAG: hypothetical protein KKA73_29325 [Chloroflexi bacterium]|nr:hypothetical protein [Chloroflexota bacterium]MBU1751798.1 hypothetical protein [Chloroflexota bacterium]
MAKTTVPQADGTTRVRRRYDQARPPFDRLCETEATRSVPAHREQLTAWRDQTDPRQLRQQIQHELDQLWALPKAQPGVSENVHQTLLSHLTIGPDNPLRFAFNRTPLRAEAATDPQGGARCG